jgi:hypothetical protein
MGQRRSGNTLLWGTLLLVGLAACNLVFPYDTRTELQTVDGAPPADGALSTDGTVPDAIDGPADTGSDAQTLCDNEGEPCPGGVCHAKACCTGCWDGTTCRTGDTPDACGVGGLDCAACAAKGPCITAVCQAGTCGTAPLPEGDACTDAGTKGICHSGVCCTSCWDGTACVSPLTVAKCGVGGAACVDCSSVVTVNECQDQDCQAGSCVTFNRPDGSPCKNGKCYNGSCCTTCWDGSSNSCVPAVSVQHCGSNGDLCETCKTMAAGAPCTDISGVAGACQGSICCTGCISVDSDSCVLNLSDSACGTGGAICVNCTMQYTPSICDLTLGTCIPK